MENNTAIVLTDTLNRVSNQALAHDGVFITSKYGNGAVSSSVFTDSGLDELLLLNEVLQAVSDRADLYPFLDKFKEQLDFASSVLLREITNNVVYLNSKPVISSSIYQPENESYEG